MKVLSAVLVVAGSMALSACGGSSKTASPTTTATSGSATTAVSLAAVKQQFQTDETAIQAVEKSVGNNLSNIDPNATGPQVLTVLDPLISAAQKYETQLTGIAWPPSIVGDAHALITQIGSLVGVMQSVSSQNAFSVNTWVSQFESAGQSAHSATNILRHDLGLPPVS